jgi:phospholipid/cholesterol/gamma-HCH transport system permease protein
VGRISYFVWELIVGLREWRLWLPRAVEQARNHGYGSLFIVLLTSGFAGAVSALQAGYQLTAGVPLYFASGVVVSTIILELGPVLTGLILAGRIGARFAAELGTMRVTEQVDALESLGRSSVTHVLLPRVVAATVMVPVLTIFSDSMGVVSGWIASLNTLEMSSTDYWYGAKFFFEPFYVWYSLIKSFFFGLAIAIVPCYVGFNTSQGAEGVGKSTTEAVVATSVLILFLNALLAKLLLPQVM